MMTREELAEEKKRRFAFTRAVYEATQANQMAMVNMFEIGKELGLNYAETSRIFQYLSEERLLQSRTIGGGISITHLGIDEVESAIEEPQIPTKHFPAFNIIHVEHMTNSAIQQGNYSSSQTQTIAQNEIQALKEWIQCFRRELPNMHISEADKQEAEAELSTLDAQAGSSKPKAAIIKSSLATLKEFLIHTAALTTAHELFAHMPHFW